MTGKFRRIAVEEGFNIPEVGLRARPTGAGGQPNQAYVNLSRELCDIGEGRVAAMDAANIDMQLLMINSPGVQHLEPARAVDMAMLVNDRAAESCAKWPTRFAALAAVATPDPKAAATEIERAVTKLGLKGAIINSHTNGEYLDDKKYWPILECVQGLDVPIYLHPREPSPQMAQVLNFRQFLAGWSYAVEVGTHVLRMIAGGVFDEFPKLRFVIGHMGEAIPFYLQRMDNRYLNSVRMMEGAGAFKRLPSEYFLNHFHITTSGMNYAPQLLMTIQMVGIDRVLFAADYPFEKQKEDGTDAMDAIPLNDDDKHKIYHRNAERVFNL